MEYIKHTNCHYSSRRKGALTRFFSNLSIKWKLTIIIMSTSAITLSLASIAFTANDIFTFRSAAVENLKTMTRVVGGASLGALMFDDRLTARENLSALQEVPFIVSACIFDKNRNIFAQFARDGRSETLSSHRRLENIHRHTYGHHFDRQNLYMLQPIASSGDIYGSILVHFDLRDMYSRIKKSGVIVGVIILLVLLIALVLSSVFQRLISEPILNLVEAARNVRRSRDYTLRAEKCSNDELGGFIDDFNAMLAEIQIRDQELEKHREHLEDEVAARTAELQQINEKLVEAKESAETANLAKSEFLANMSHEIRTPMNAVIGFTELLNESITDSKQKSYLDSIRSGGGNLLTLINDILDLSKIEAGRMEIQYEPVNPNDVFEELKSIFYLKISEKGIEFIIDIDPDIPECLLLDEVRLRQVLFNLIGNAVKFTDKGYIKLSASQEVCEDDDSAVNLTIAVEDTGAGVPSESIDSIFDAFRQQDGQSTKRYGGTGLGLAISKRLMEMMKGEIRVKSELGKGSRFEIIFYNVSLAATLVKAGDDDKTFYDTIRFDDAKILIVDDIKVNRSLVIAYFEDADILFLEAADGESAVRQARIHRPDVILMDIRMPVMDGYEATRRIKNDSALSHIPVIALTASGMKSDREKSKKFGFDAFLTKPVRKSDLIKELMAYIPYTSETAPEPEPLQKGEYAGETPETETNELKLVIHQLETELTDEWNHAGKNGFFEEIDQFGSRIREIGEQRRLEPLVAFGDDLKKYVNHFDVGRINEIMSQYPDLVQTVKDRLFEC